MLGIQKHTVIKNVYIIRDNKENMENIKKQIGEKKRVTKISEVIDQNTGEILSAKTESVYYPKERDYIKLYLEHVFEFNQIASKSSTIVSCILEEVNFHNEIVLHAEIRKRIAERSNTTTNRLSHVIADLCKSDLLVKKSNNFYIINPQFVGRGDLSSINTAKIEYEYVKGLGIQRTYSTDNQTRIIQFDRETLPAD